MRSPVLHPGALPWWRSPAPDDRSRPDALRGPRRMGLGGSLMLAVGALGAGAQPVPNPLAGLRLIGLPARNPTLSLAVAYAGLVLVVLAWARVMLVLRASPHPGRRDLMRAVVTWIVPLALAPPLFSRDIYSYLAQGMMVARGLDPYRVGPAAALGIDDTLVRSIPALWRDTPSPYGPLFLLIGRGVATVTGEDVVAGVFAYRLLALAGLAMIMWALPRLARRAGADPERAFWLGAANPLVLFHLVSGVHNDGLMIGLMLAGLELGLRGRRAPLVAGVVLIVTASAVKIPAVLALPYLASAVVGRPLRVAGVVRTAALMTGVAAAVYVPLTLAMGVGTAWVTAPEAPGNVISFLSLTTDLAIVGTAIGAVAGLGVHVDAVLALWHGVGTATALVLVARNLALTARHGRDPLAGLAVGLAIVGLLAVQTQPWYLLWALVPAAAAHGPRLHAPLGYVCVALALLVPPTGGDFVFRGFELANAVGAAVVLLGAWAAIQQFLTVRGRRPAAPQGRR